MCSSLAGIIMMFGTMACVEQSGSIPDNEMSWDPGEPSPPDGIRKSLTSEDTPLPPDGSITVTQDCVYIQWCDEPPPGGSSRVVGKVRPACFSQCWNDALINEFKGDARAVCGKTSLDDELWRIDCF
jgi:hypothetical protein